MNCIEKIICDQISISIWEFEDIPISKKMYKNTFDFIIKLEMETYKYSSSLLNMCNTSGPNIQIIDIIIDVIYMMAKFSNSIIFIKLELPFKTIASFKNLRNKRKKLYE